MTDVATTTLVVRLRAIEGTSGVDADNECFPL